MKTARVYRSLDLAMENIAIYSEEMKQNIYIASRKCFSNTESQSFIEYFYITEEELKKSFIFDIIHTHHHSCRERICSYILQSIKNLGIQKYVPKARNHNFVDFEIYTDKGNIFKIGIKKSGTFEMEDEA